MKKFIRVFHGSQRADLSLFAKSNLAWKCLLPVLCLILLHPMKSWQESRLASDISQDQPADPP